MEFVWSFVKKRVAFVSVVFFSCFFLFVFFAGTERFVSRSDADERGANTFDANRGFLIGVPYDLRGQLHPEKAAATEKCLYNSAKGNPVKKKN